MTAHPNHNEEFRFGSADWSDEIDLRRAGLFAAKGLQIGYWGKRPVFVDGDAPIVLVGGAGSGKLRDTLSFIVCKSPGQRKLVLDPRGEIAAISLHNFARYGEHAYCFNPAGLHGLPQHRLNPLDILKPDSPTLYSDAKFIAEGLIPLSGGGSARYFELRARQWLEALMIALTLHDGSVDFASLMTVVNAIESDPQVWGGVLEFMLDSNEEVLRSTAAELLTKQQESEKEFGAIIGEVFAYLSVFNDPLLQASLSEPDLSLEDLCDSSRVNHLFLNVPIEYVGIWSPLLRVIFTVGMLYKGRHPSAPRLNLIADEAGQLGRFEGLLRAFTFGRGAGIRALAVFQDIGQVKRNFGAEALQGFMGSAQTRLFYGVRDLETAEYVSNMLGTQTLEYDEDLNQSTSERHKKEIVRRVMNGEDPTALANEYRQHKFAENYKTKQSRALMTPSEVLAMPEDSMIAFVSGKDLDPLYLHKRAYFHERSMAGFYLPNPYHPPKDRVRIQTRFGARWRKVITAPVPERYSHYPQYQSGTWSYVQGHKPSS